MGCSSSKSRSRRKVRSKPKAEEKVIFRYTFILFGKINSGKSALGNLLLGPGATTQFSTHPRPEPSGHTKKIQSGEAELEASSVYGEGYTGNNRVKIQVIDQPGCNDTEHFMFSTQCIELSKSKKVNFLIVIDLNSSFFSQSEFLSIMKIAKIISESKHSFFSNAIIIFTHADILQRNLNQGNLEEIVQQKLQQENYGYVQELLNLVEQRHIFVNAVNTGVINRYEILKKIFQLPKHKLNVYISGNGSFKGSELKQIFEEENPLKILRERTSTSDIEYKFSPDIEPIRKGEIITLKNDIVTVLDKLNEISKGISAIIILINLKEKFTEETYNQIINLPKTYNLEDSTKHDFWDYACIVFKALIDTKRSVERQIDANPRLQSLDRMVHSRYCWFTDRNLPEECSERIDNLVKEVASFTKLGTYTDAAVVGEMADQIQENFAHKYAHDLTPPPEPETIDVPVEGVMLADRDVLLSINHILWGTKYTNISTRIGHFVLKNINADLAKEFRRQYPDGRIATETFVDFCLEH